MNSGPVYDTREQKIKSNQEVKKIKSNQEVKKITFPSHVQVQRPHIQEVQVCQVSCTSQSWTVSTLSTNTLKGIHIGSRETLQLMLKGTQKPKASGDQLLYSEVPFDMERIDSTKTPCVGFYQRSVAGDRGREVSTGQQGSGSSGSVGHSGTPDFTDLEAALHVELTLIFLWKAPSHQPPLKFRRDLEAERKEGPSADVTTHRLSFTYHHPPTTTHDFSTGMCVVEVGVSLQNHALCPVQVLVDSSKSSDRLNAASSQDKGSSAAMPSSSSSLPPLTPASPPSPYPLSSSMRWVGLTLAKVTLGQGESTRLKLRAGFLRAGTYNVNTLAVFVTCRDNRFQMTLQRQATPNIITLTPQTSHAS